MSGILPRDARPIIEFGVSSFAIPGEVESGDRHAIKTWGACAMAAVVDGAGHGEEAARAAKKAIGIIETHAEGSVAATVRSCHHALRGTRGAVMSLARFDADRNTMTWLGVGNVHGVILRAHPQTPSRDVMLLYGGLVGHNLPFLRVETLPVAPGDLLILATDGIRVPFDEGFTLHDPPQRIAEWICSQFGKTIDDGLALVIRYLGRAE